MPFVSVAYFVPAGYRALARARAVVAAKPLVLPGLLERLQLDATALVLDTTDAVQGPRPYVRRMLTFELSTAFLQSFTTDSARASPFVNLFTAQVQMLTGGIGVTAAAPILFLTPLEIFGETVLDTWWRADTTATPAIWAPRYGARIATQPNVPQQFALVNDPLARGLPVFTSVGGVKGMQTPAIAPLPQPWSVALIGVLSGNANQTLIDGLGIDTARLFVDAGNLAFRTAAAPQLTDAAAVPNAALLGIGSANGAASTLYNNNQIASGAAGAGTPTGITIGNDAMLAAGMTGEIADVLLIKSTVNADQAQALAGYARGWYGVGVVP